MGESGGRTRRSPRKLGLPEEQHAATVFEFTLRNARLRPFLLALRRIRWKVGMCLRQVSDLNTL